MAQKRPTRREVLKKAAYMAPVILTLPAIPSIAASGSNPAEKPQFPIIGPPSHEPGRGPEKK